MADVANVGPSAGQTPVPRTSWDPDMLYIHLSTQIEQLKGHLGDLRTADLLTLQAAFAAAEKAVDRAMVAQEKAVLAALEADQRTTSLLQATDQKLSDMQSKYTEGHLHQLNDSAKRSVEERTHFVSVDAYNAAHAPLVKDVEDLKLSRERDRGKQLATTAAVGVIFAIISLAMRFL